MAVFLEENQATNPIQARGNFKQADYFGNLMVEVTKGDGTKAEYKLAAAKLFEGKEFDDMIINGFKEDPEGFGKKLLSKMTIKFNSSTPTKQGLSL